MMRILFWRKKTTPQPTGPIVEKRRVTMLSEQGHRAIDFVPLAYLEAYVADARTRWDRVIVGHVHDSGPGGDHGPTADLSHLDAKQ